MKSIKIVYEAFMLERNPSPHYVVAEILFSEKTTEYVNGMSYRENMEAMIFDIMETGVVFVNDGQRDIAIPIFSIKQYFANEEPLGNYQNRQQNQQGQQKQKWKPINHKKMQRRIESQNKPLQNQTPIKPEEVINSKIDDISGNV